MTESNHDPKKFPEVIISDLSLGIKIETSSEIETVYVPDAEILTSLD